MYKFIPTVLVNLTSSFVHVYQIELPPKDEEYQFVLMYKRTNKPKIQCAGPINIKVVDGKHCYIFRNVGIFSFFSGDIPCKYLRFGTNFETEYLVGYWLSLNSVSAKGYVEQQERLEALERKVQILQELVDRPEAAGAKYSYDEIQKML